MASLTSMNIFLTTLGGAVMVYVMLRAIGQSAAIVAWENITERRAAEAERHAADAAAEAAGRAAALEPLALRSDGSIEEPIVAIVEQRS